MAGNRALTTTGPQWRAMINNKSVRRMMRAATKRARVVRVMMTTMRVARDKEGDGNGGKSNGSKGFVQ